MPSSTDRPRAAHHAVLAMTDVRYAVWVARVLATAGVSCTYVATRADLYDVIAAGPTALVLEDQFDGAPAEAVLATLRTAGAPTPAFVLAMWKRPPLLGRLRALAPAIVIADPFDCVAIGLLVRASTRRSWAVRHAAA